ncbi:MAG: hypothetical protein N2Z67_05625 [Acetobacteraceae bacterium]|nr:hypothetical protein [Acetobacteraceae bacterium]
MSDPGTPAPVPAHVPPGVLAATEALLDLHLSATRRFAAAIRAADPARRAKRPDEACWCCAAVALGTLRHRRITHKDLVAMAAGRLSPATLSRAVQDAVMLGLLRQEQLAGNRRMKRLALTEAGWRLLVAGAEEAWAAALAVLRRAEARMAGG